MSKKIMVVIGTRPEAIKMCPVILELNKRKGIDVVVCVTAQHREMLDSVLEIFSIIPDYDLNIMKTGQSLSYLTSEMIKRLEEVFDKEQPDIVLVHGDTTTSYVAALVSFYKNIKIGHVEAGLRTYNMKSPFPEEFNRQSIDLVADYYFAPTEQAKENLLREGRNVQNVYVTGNTAIDALKMTVKEDFISDDLEWGRGHKLILLTAHRRENIGKNMKAIFSAINRIVDRYHDVKVIYPIHMNPKVRELAAQYLTNQEKIRIIEPMDVSSFHNLMAASYMIVTDSGGIQEEAPSLGVPVLVIRTTTERPEGIAAGTLKLIGVTEKEVYENICELLENSEMYVTMSTASNPYGDGFSAKRIVDILEK